MDFSSAAEARRRPSAVAIRVALIYAVFGLLWILLSDHILGTLVTDTRILTKLQTIKGWAYVVVSALLIYGIVQRYFVAAEKSRQLLEHNEQRYRTIVETSLDGILVVDADGVIVTSNHRFADLWGIPSDVMESRSDEQALQSILDTLADPGPFLARVQHLYEHRDETSHEELPLTNGRVLERYSAPMIGQEGRYYGRVWQFRDITERKRAEAALRDNENRYRSLFEAAGDAIFLMEENRFVDCNPKTVEMFGCTREQIINATPYRFSPANQPDGRPSEEKAVEKITAALAGRQQFFEWRHCRLDGTEFDTEITLTPLTISGKPHVLAIVRDVSDRKRAEAAIRENEARLREVQEMAHLGSWCWDVKTGEVQWSQEVYKIFRLDPKEFIPRIDSVLALSPWPEDHERDKELIRRAMESHEKGSYEQRFLRPDKSIGYYYSIFQGRYDERGELVSIVGTIMDITDRKRAELALRESEATLRSVFRAAPVGICIMKDRVYQASNECWCETVGYREEELLGQTTRMFYEIEEEYQRIGRELYSQLGERGIASAETRLLCKDGSFRDVILTAAPLRPEAPSASTVVAIHDVTERKRSERSLHRLNRELRAISECNKALVRAVDEQTLLNEICRIVCEVAGYRMAWVGFAEHDEDRTVRPVAWNGAEDAYLANAKMSWAYTPRGRGPTGTSIRDGKTYYIKDFETSPEVAPWREAALNRGYRSSIALPLLDEDQNAFGALTIYASEPNAFTPEEIRLLDDLSADMAFGVIGLRIRAERKRAEEALRESEATLRGVFRATPVGICIMKDRVFQASNEHWCEIIGYREEEVLRQTPRMLYENEEEYQRVGRELYAEPGERGIASAETRLWCKDGSFRDVILTAAPLRLEDRSADTVVAVYDVTERKRAQEEILKLNQELEERVRTRTAQLESANRDLSEFAYVVSHDLKAPLRAVSQLAHWVAEDYASVLDEEGKNKLALMGSRIKRLYRLIDGILAYSRIGRTEERRSPVDLETLVGEVVESLTPPPHIRITVENALPVVTADRTRMEQVFQNLLGNAITFMDKPEGLITIGCEDAGDRWRFRVADNGPGIDAKYHEKVFGIFQTLAPRDQQESTGIGLTLVKKIVELYNGKVELTSEVGKGCAFSFTLPK